MIFFIISVWKVNKVTRNGIKMHMNEKLNCIGLRNSSVSKKPGKTAEVIQYCSLSRFF
jgi:hypothetical protein